MVIHVLDRSAFSARIIWLWNSMRIEPIGGMIMKMIWTKNLEILHLSILYNFFSIILFLQDLNSSFF